MRIQSKLPSVGTTIFTKMSALANQYDAVNLSKGFPDFEVDSELIELVQSHMRKGNNQYAPMTGAPALRNAIGSKIAKLYNVNLDCDEEIVVTAGATQAIFTAISAFVKLCGPSSSWILCFNLALSFLSDGFVTTVGIVYCVNCVPRTTPPCVTVCPASNESVYNMYGCDVDDGADGTPITVVVCVS